MKKLFAAMVALSVAVASMAEGYQVNTLSAKQLGMGHTGVALKLGAESMIFNPAGMAFSDKTLDLSGSFTGIISSCTAENFTVMGQPHPGKFETSNKVSTPIAVNAAFKIYDNLYAGVSFYTPYGSGINWGENWPGAVMNQRVKLQTFTVQPTIAWRIKNFSIGAGLNIAWGNVDLNKGIVDPHIAKAAFGAIPGYDEHLVPASIGITGNSEIAVGVNIGAMWEVTERVTLGVDFRSKMNMKVKAGNASVTYGNQPEMVKNIIQEKLSYLDDVNFSAAMPLPYVFQFGIGYKPTDRWTLAFDAQLTGWHTYRELNIRFDMPEALQKQFNQHIEKNYRDAWCFHTGAEFKATERLDLRAGLMVDTTPVDKNRYNPETPGMTKIEPTLGFSFRPISHLSIDFSLMYVAGVGADNTKCSAPNVLVPGTSINYSADYKLHAWVPSLGLSLSF